MTEKLSVVIITYNEEKNIDVLIGNLDFADEVVVVDSVSTDATINLLKKYPQVKVYQHKFEDFSTQRNYSLDYATHDWVLVLDADERLSDQLKKEITQVINSNPKENGFYIKRQFYFKGELVRFSGLTIDKNLRLFRKNGVRYKGLVHEKPTVAKPIGTLKHALSHYSYESFEHYLGKVVYYNRLKAIEKYEKGYKPSFLKKIFHPIYTFFSRYIIRMGILDGKKGIVLSYIYAKGISERYKELDNLNKRH